MNIDDVHAIQILQKQKRRDDTPKRLRTGAKPNEKRRDMRTRGAIGVKRNTDRPLLRAGLALRLPVFTVKAWIVAITSRGTIVEKGLVDEV